MNPVIQASTPSRRPLSQAIVERTREAGKTYQFQEAHDPALPAAHWFQQSDDGLTFFLVLYTQACRWARCTGCNLPSTQSRNHVGFEDIMRQTDHVFDRLLSSECRRDLGKVILSNNGSVLDQDTFSTAALMYFIARMKFACPGVKTLTIETRPEYVDIEELEILSRALNEGRQKTGLELAIGFEAFDETIRNGLFGKGLTLDVFEQFAARCSQHGFRIKTYFMLKPVPAISEEDAIQDIQQAFEYLHGVATKCKASINVHLNPTYVAKGTPLEEAFLAGRYTPPSLYSLQRAVMHAEGKQLSVFTGLSDEGLSVPGGSFIRPGDEEIIKKFEAFNTTQDFSLLRTAQS